MNNKSSISKKKLFLVYDGHFVETKALASQPNSFNCVILPSTQRQSTSLYYK